MRKRNDIGLVAKSFAVGALIAAALGMHKDADAQQCTGPGCAAPANSSAAQSLANGGSSKTNVWALPGGGVSAAGVPGSGDFYGALVNSCLRSFGIGALSIGYSNANAGRYDTTTDENGNHIPGEVQQCIDSAIKQHNTGILMQSPDPIKAYVGIKAAAEKDSVLSGALTDAQQRSAACVDGELNAVGVCGKNKAAAAAGTAVVPASVVAAAVPAPVVMTGSDATCDKLKKAFANGVPKNQCSTGWKVAGNCSNDAKGKKPIYYCDGEITSGIWLNTSGLDIAK